MISCSRKTCRVALAGAVALCSGMAPAGDLLAKAPVDRAAQSAAVSGDPAHGGMLYQACMGCHAIDENDVGPRHRGVVGRRAGAVPGYAYSQALRASGLTWTPANLDKWLTNPQALVPGARMYFSIPKVKDRADIIAFLATQK